MHLIRVEQKVECPGDVPMKRYSRPTRCIKRKPHCFGVGGLVARCLEVSFLLTFSSSAIIEISFF